MTNDEDTKLAPQNRLHAVLMAKQEPKRRIHSFDEVALGYTEEEALAEASRCLNCPKPQCVKGCPVELDIPAFVKLIKEKRYNEAIRKVKEKTVYQPYAAESAPKKNNAKNSAH